MPRRKLCHITTNTKRLTQFVSGAMVDKPATEGCVDELFLLDAAGRSFQGSVTVSGNTTSTKQKK